MMTLTLDTSSIDDYRKFIKAKGLPYYRVKGRQVMVPDEYSHLFTDGEQTNRVTDYTPSEYLFDYQRDISELAIRKKKFAVFADCGLGKTSIILEFANHANQAQSRNVLIISPLMVVPQTIDESKRFYGDAIPLEWIRAAGLREWLNEPRDKIGITNYDALADDLPTEHVGAIILDESSILKSHYGKWGNACLRLGEAAEYKLACTGTPAPNDRVEYANHAVFCGHHPTVNGFLAKYFVNRGQTQNRWELKAHATDPFYRALSHWCIFLTDPATYGWKDNCETIPPIHVHTHHVPLTEEQTKLAYNLTGELFANNIGGITNRQALSGIAKGSHKGKAIPTNKTQFIRDMIDGWPDESTIIWCQYNHEQESVAKAIPEAVSITGSTPIDKRHEMIDAFKSGKSRVLISKPKILGFGLNLQVATRQVFSGLMDSYESYYQAVKRSNRYGSTRPLNVHIPLTDIERPMVETVLRKAARVDEDTRQQERIFKQCKDGI